MWAPAIAGLRSETLGGRGPYSDVVEEFDLNITGATASAALANLDTLNRLLDQAERWYRNEKVTAVLLKYAPQGSTISSTATPLQCAILGRAPGDTSRSPVMLPPNANDVGMTKVIFNVRVRLWRHGEWLWSSEARTSSSVNVGDVATVTFATTSTPYAAPALLNVAGFTAGGGALSNAVLLVSPSGGLARVEAESMATAPFTSVADAANKASANVLRYTPASAGVFSQTFGTTGVFPTTGYLLAVYATVRNNSATATFTIRLVNDVTGEVLTRDTVIDASSLTPRVVFLGVLINPPGTAAGARFGVAIEASVSSVSGSPTLDVDVLYGVRLDSELGRVIEIISTSPPSFSSGSKQLFLDPQRLTEPQPAVYQELDPSFQIGGPLSYRGDALLQVKDACNVALLAVGGSAAARWRYTDPSNNVETLTFTVTRPVAYLTPQ
jgi:hypothetical protein